VVLGLGAVLFLGEEKTNTEQRRQPANQTRRIFPEAGSLYSGPEETEVSDDGQDYLSENVRKHLHMGMRELREGNYGRALSQFTTARSLDPTNRKVLMQIKITRQRMLEESKDLWRLGHLEARGGRYQAALNHFCQIMKIIKSDPEGALDRKVAANGQEVYGERFNKAKEAYQEVLSKMENHENRHHCSF
jgi:tetratricopeptide (TPR) repeat protein